MNWSGRKLLQYSNILQQAGLLKPAQSVASRARFLGGTLDTRQLGSRENMPAAARILQPCLRPVRMGVRPARDGCLEKAVYEGMCVKSRRVARYLRFHRTRPEAGNRRLRCESAACSTTSPFARLIKCEQDASSASGAENLAANRRSANESCPASQWRTDHTVDPKQMSPFLQLGNARHARTVQPQRSPGVAQSASPV